MQHVFQMWVCAPQADPQCKLPNLCLLVQLRVMRTGADSWAQAPFSPVWSRRKAFVLSWKQTESKFRRPNNNFLNSINRSLLGVVKCSIWSCRPFERQGRFSPFQSVPEEPEGRVCQNTVYAVVWLQLENALCSRKNRRRGWPWVVVGAHCWGVSAPRCFPCSCGSPSGSPSSVPTAAWENFIVF